MDDTETKILQDIERVGWSLIGVEADQEGPSFVYSIGMMHSLDHPEIVMFGQKVPLMVATINGIGEEIRQGRPFTEPGLYDGLIEGYACKIVRVDEVHHPEYFGYAMWHRRCVGRVGTLRVVQCLWPDKEGIFPDEPGCSPVVVGLQPLLNRR